MIDPMTAEEIAAAREWIGLSEEEISDAEIVEAVQSTIWLAKRRLNGSIGELADAVAIAIREDAELVRKMIVGVL